MRSENRYKDFKSAAAGDDLWGDESAGFGVEAAGEPVATRSDPGLGQRTNRPQKTIVGPSEPYDPARTKVWELARRFTNDPDTGILLKFGKSQPGSGMGLGPYCCRETELDANELVDCFAYDGLSALVPMETHQPGVRSLKIERSKITHSNGKSFSGILFEIGFWISDKNLMIEPVYLGRIKYFLPKLNQKGMVYFDVS